MSKRVKYVPTTELTDPPWRQDRGAPAGSAIRLWPQPETRVRERQHAEVIFPPGDPGKIMRRTVGSGRRCRRPDEASSVPSAANSGGPTA